MQPKKFSEYTPITETDGSEVIPILKAGVNATVKSEDLPISTATQTAIDAADADIAAHIADVANPHEVTKAQVGLGNADNTSDANKPVSTAQATAIALKADQSTTYTKTEVDTKDTAVADTAQTNLTAHTSNTSNPHATTKAQVGLANADNTSDVDKPISAATQTALDEKATNTALDAHTNNTSNPHSVTKTQVGLGNVDNTSDINKPVSTAQATADAAVASTAASNLATHTSNTSNPHSVTKSQVGLGNADNTSDANKPVSTAQQTALNNKATLLNIQQSSVPYRSLAGSGEPNTEFLVSSGTTVSTIASRDSNGNISAATPTQAFHLTRKDYVDAAGALKLNISDNRVELRGTGFPQGVVSAPVGTTYVDTNATNGAIEWKKATGTGNTGWIVSVGDTGWRWLTSLAPAGNVIAGSFAIRRTNNTVFIRGDNLTLSEANAVLVANATADIGSGFMPMENYEAISRISASTYVPTIAFSVQPGSTVAGLRRFGASNAAYSTAQWSTVRDWPTTLPGTA